MASLPSAKILMVVFMAATLVLPADARVVASASAIQQTTTPVSQSTTPAESAKKVGDDAIPADKSADTAGLEGSTVQPVTKLKHSHRRLITILIIVVIAVAAGLGGRFRD